MGRAAFWGPKCLQVALASLPRMLGAAALGDTAIHTSELPESLEGLEGVLLPGEIGCGTSSSECDKKMGFSVYVTTIQLSARFWRNSYNGFDIK